MKKKPDKYDRAIAYLTKHPTHIYAAWRNPTLVRGGMLFKFYGAGGCLTQVKAGDFKAATPELTRRIRADKRIPDSVEGIGLQHLPVFAEWQRRLDKKLNRK